MPVVERGRFGARARARVLSGALVTALGLDGIGTASAQADFQVPAACGTHAEFSHELERLLGAEAASAEPQSVFIDGGSNGADYRLRIVLREGTRELRHADCRTLFRSAVVIAAASYREERRRREAPNTVPTALLVSPVTPVRAPPPEEPPARIGFFLAGGIGAAIGPLPGVAPLFEISGGAVQEQLGLSLALRYLSGTEERSATGKGVLVTGLGARLMVSYQPWRPFRAALGVGVYRLLGEGRGTSDSRSDVTYAVEPALELSAIPIHTESFELGLAVGAHWAAVQPRFLIEGYGPVFEVPEFGGEGLFRAAWLIP
ncbi:MAG TPA: hypothetical protein VF103_05790 [Polyangiaceae bacterium]